MPSTPVTTPDTQIHGQVYPTATATYSATLTPLPSPTIVPTSTPVKTPSPTLTYTPTITPTPTPTSPVTSTPEVTPEVQPTAEPASTIVRSYEWSYAHRDWSWSLKVSQESYDYYKQIPRAQTENYSIYVTHPGDDEYLDMLIDKIREAAAEAGFDEWETINFAVAFVQSLPYTADDSTTGYDEFPRYPVETLVDNGGDCEDTSILMTALLKQMGYGVVLVSLPEHMAVGVLGGEGVYGTYYEHNGGKYYYLETTGEGWEIGEMPPAHKDQSAHIYDIVAVPILTQVWDATYRGNDWTVTVTVENQGTAGAFGAYIQTGFDAGNDMYWDLTPSRPFDLPAGYKRDIVMNLTAPSQEYTRLMVEIVFEGYAVDKSYSEWLNTY